MWEAPALPSEPPHFSWGLTGSLLSSLGVVHGLAMALRTATGWHVCSQGIKALLLSPQEAYVVENLEYVVIYHDNPSCLDLTEGKESAP